MELVGQMVWVEDKPDAHQDLKYRLLNNLGQQL